ncbi:MAG: tRNA uridine-5-carboxymethylaminomethyl(34) synthesis GTPase MnmE [bacterium]
MSTGSISDSFETIAAISTPFGESGIGIVRLSGIHSFMIIKKIFVPSNSKSPLIFSKSHTIHHGFIIDPDKHTEIDEVLVTLMKAPKTYTREDIIEINCHGGLLPLRKTLDLALQYGARLAMPGEFTKRAFLNGRIDITQAEAVLDIIRSKNDYFLRNSLKQIKGDLRDLILVLRNKLISIYALVEKKLDFQDDDNEFSLLDISTKLNHFHNELEIILGNSVKQNRLINGMKVVIIGKANVGKSSLLNSLCENDTSIICDIPGTTRDIVKEEVVLKGYFFTICDTAGIKIPENIVERLSIKKTYQYINKSDIVLYLIDTERGINKTDFLILKNIKKKYILYIINKYDLENSLSTCYNTFEKYPEFKSIEWLKISAKTGYGLLNLKKKLISYRKNDEENIQEALMLNERQYFLLKEVRRSIYTTINLLKNNHGLELISESIKEGLKKLDFITGNSISEDTLNNIFKNFCIGK